jgi:hypothetical protein
MMCISSQLLCWSLNATQCATRRYCSWVTAASFANSYCNYTTPLIAPATALAQEMASTCPALHPVVLAILVVMFITLLGAIAVVVVVVVMNKKKQEDLDREDEEAEAAAAVGHL